ncbi:hypothetical protein LUZ60_006863 [Juncus effusus]|nr:hypothetical protein LUZ60_006863 [Juncus effusus]
MEDLCSPIESLPEDCVSHVISLTSPRTVCISATASPIFRSAADSDATWQRFMPSDCSSILARSVDPVEYSSKKDLFLRLCKSHVLIDGGLMSFGLESSSGKKCYMISARALEIVWGDSPKYWRWISLPDSRFEEVAELIEVCWLEIRGKISVNFLSPNTTYTCYLIYKLTDSSNGLGCPLGMISQQTSVSLNKQTNRSSVCLQSFHKRLGGFRRFKKYRLMFNSCETVERSESEAREGKEREDGWMEVEMGEIWCGEGVEGEVEMSMSETKGHWKSGLLVQGIEIRPKV